MLRYKTSMIRNIAQVNQFVRVFSGTGTRFCSREQLIPVPDVPVAASVKTPCVSCFLTEYAQEIAVSKFFDCRLHTISVQLAYQHIHMHYEKKTRPL